MITPVFNFMRVEGIVYLFTSSTSPTSSVS
jgi:hypothetical protein